MPQLNLNFSDIPIPETCLWEQFDDEQKRIVIETLARLLAKATAQTRTRSRPMTDPSKIKPTHTQRVALFTFASPRPAKSSIIANPLPASTPWPTGPVNWVGPKSR